MISRVLTTFLSVLSVPSVALVVCAPSMALVLSALSIAQTPTKRVDIVSVTGCLREQGTNWMLLAATEPVPSVANQPQAAELPTAPPNGKNTFRLIGTSEFNLPQMKDRTVVIRGLLIKDKVSRINVTSAVEAVATCAPAAPK
jgi:hypothetical protein